MGRILSCVAAALVSIASMAGADTLTLVADPWCPYGCDPKSEDPGYLIEIAQAAFEKQRHQIEYRIVPWDTAAEETRKGTYHAVVGAYIDEVPDFVFPANELGIAEDRFMVRKGDPWRYNGPASLKGKKVGTVPGYTYGKELDAFFAANPGVSQPTEADDPAWANIEELLDGKLDAVLENSNVLSLSALTHHVLGSMTDAGTIGHDKVYIAFSPAKEKSREYAKILSDGVEELRRSGKLAKILSKYGLNDWR